MADTDQIEQPKRKPGRPPKVPAVTGKEAVTPAKEFPPVTKAAKPSPVAKVPAPAPIAQAVRRPEPVAPEPVAAMADVVETALPNPAEVAEVLEAVSSPAVLSDVVEAPAAAVAPLEEVKTMATIEIPTVEKAQAMFGDVSERIKTAFEKSTKVGEEMVELAKGNAEAVVASAKIAAKGGETMGQEAAEYGKKSFESAMALFKSFTSVRSPSEFFQLQSDYAKSSIESLVAETSKTSESLLKLVGEVVQPLSNRYAVATEKLKAATTL